METVCVRVESVQQGVNNLISKFEEQQIKTPRKDENLCRPPDTPSCFQGFDEHMEKVKTLVLADGVNVIEITAMGGAGKSTLAAAVCNDNEIRGCFKDRIIYIVVSKSALLLNILKTLWRNIVGEEAPEFTGVEHAYDQLQLQIKENEPILVVLDDIWSNFEVGKLLFEGKQYKTLVTTRAKSVIPKGPRTHNYKLPSLQPQYALSLFCHYAFDKPSIPIGRDKELIEKVQQQCKGLPLALKVIGRSLFGESDPVWERAEKSLSAGESFRDDHKESLLNKLKTSIDVLGDNERECFLDLGAFPQRKTIPAKELLDIWVYVRRMKWSKAEMLLWKFEDHHLLDLKKNPGTAENTDDCMDGYSFSQHGVMRDLALYLANQDNKTQCRRLFMPTMENDFPPDWETSKAQVVSIHTGAMQDTDWPKMEFPEVEALVLYFTASEYCIPTFLHKMKNLKVLIIHNNDGAKRSKLSGVAGFQELSQLKTLHLEKVTVPEECKVLKSLEKIHMILCEGLGRDKTFDFPELLEFNVDCCIDLEELPAGLCSSIFLKTLSVTHCHRLAKLPDELDKLGSLKEIRLCESLGLETLPSSICSLKKLKLLDISSCIHMKVSRGVRCELNEILQTLAQLAFLKRVICDKKHEWLFKRSSRTDLKVQVVKEKEPNLDWLDWGGRN
ncbi:probable disease resistance protein At4g33300 [Cryptomeria japonica]|uniref:probable disease resistance protein At4g33300 n=1 Tax=Cryptomeria japonica TaxID=3369 RepID=UPI0025AC1637|nr:probable disease resistance protein At4g33300 [Cryptomeria japonica]